MSNFIPITAGRNEYSFSLASNSAGAHSGVVGWLLITWDDDGVLNPAEPGLNIAASAFLVNLINYDAAFLPVVPLNVDDYNLATPITLLNPPNSPLISMMYGQSGSIALESRFLISASGDPRTGIVVFTPLNIPTTLDAEAVSATGTIQPGITIFTTNQKLNVFNPEEIVPASFTEGALVISNPAEAPIGIQFSLTFWSVVGAEQTIIANELTGMMSSMGQ